MSKSTIYVGVDVSFKEAKGLPEDNFHITLLYSNSNDQRDKTGRLYVPNIRGIELPVLSLEYWSKPDVTVLTVGDNVDITNARQGFEDAGFFGDLPLIPHVTLGKGDCTSSFKGIDICGNFVILGESYIKVF